MTLDVIVVWLRFQRLHLKLLPGYADGLPVKPVTPVFHLSPNMILKWSSLFYFISACVFAACLGPVQDWSFYFRFLPSPPAPSSQTVTVLDCSGTPIPASIKPHHQSHHQLKMSSKAELIIQSCFELPCHSVSLYYLDCTLTVLF